MADIPLSFNIWDLLDILLVAFIIYRILLLIKGTRTFQVLLGLVVITATYMGSKVLGLVTLSWMLNTFLSSIILVIVILFQNDIRRGLAHMGRHPMLLGNNDSGETAECLDEVVRAAMALAGNKTGALIVLERETSLQHFIEGGIPLDANLGKDLLCSIFLADSPLHDGAVIIRGRKIILASAILPLTSRIDLEQEFGTRHRAALGLTEETDAVVIVVSEERGTFSIVLNGKITRDLDAVSLRKVLARLFPGPREKSRKSRTKARPRVSPKEGAA